jgi:hypothetical protein
MFAVPDIMEIDVMPWLKDARETGKSFRAGKSVVKTASVTE